MPKQDGSELIIPLSVDAIQNPHASDLRVLTAYMLWPRDSLWRERWLAEFYVSKIRKDHPERAAETIALAQASLPAKMLTDEIKRANIIRDAGLASSVFRDHLACRVFESKTTKATVIENVIKARDKSNNIETRKASLEPKTFENKIWSNFSCVVHLWAAKYLADRDHGQSGRWPCAEDYLPTFLADAEGFRMLGEQTKMLRASGKAKSITVLNPKDTYKLPTWIKVEPTELTIHGPLRGELCQ
jgi:hypothetical protein